MKKLISVVLCAALSCSLLAACADTTEMTANETLSSKYTRTKDIDETFNYSDGATDSPLSYNNYISEVTDFEFRLFRNMYKQNSNGNMSVAPVNTALQLGLLANGASGDTQKEIITALGDELTLDMINQSSSYFKSRIQAVANITTEKNDSLSGKKISSELNGGVNLKNTLCVNDTSDIKTKFLQSNADYYGSDIFRFDFSGENALAKISGIFSDYTSNNTLTLNSSDKMFSVTASDIYDAWLEPYAQTDIETGEFNSETGSVSVKYMRSNESYMKTSTAEGIVKYMSSTPLKLVLIMPDEDITLSDYISDFTAQRYEELLNSIDYKTKAEAKIPEFSISSETVNITDCLTSSGLYTSFTEDSNFFTMSSSDEFMFNAMYEISPEISVSAAGISGATKCDSSNILAERTTELESCDTEIIFNRPFMFMIIDNESNLPLYIGTVENL